MGGPKQKGVIQYCECLRGHAVHAAYLLLAALSPYQQNTMHGALRGYVFYGYKRIMQQAPYFALPFGIGEYGRGLQLCVGF